MAEFFDGAGTLTLNQITIGSNQAIWVGGGMFLANPSTTNFNGVIVSGNVAWAGGNIAVAGSGIYEEINATVNPKPPGPPNIELTDNDDPGGNPVVGP